MVHSNDVHMCKGHRQAGKQGPMGPAHMTGASGLVSTTWSAIMHLLILQHLVYMHTACSQPNNYHPTPEREPDHQHHTHYAHVCTLIDGTQAKPCCGHSSTMVLATRPHTCVHTRQQCWVNRHQSSLSVAIAGQPHVMAVATTLQRPPRLLPPHLAQQRHPRQVKIAEQVRACGRRPFDLGGLTCSGLAGTNRGGLPPLLLQEG